MDFHVQAARVAILVRGHGDRSHALRSSHASGCVIDALDALCRGQGGALARLKVATHACAAELRDRAVPSSAAVDAITELIAECWTQGAVPAPAPLVREALVDVVGSWCVDELDRIARATAERPAPRYSRFSERA